MRTPLRDQTMADLQHIHRVLRTELEREAAAGFPRLSRVPDTHVRHYVDYYRSLDGTRQAALIDASTLWGTNTLAGSIIGGRTVDGIDVQSVMRSNQAWTDWFAELANGASRDPHWYTSVPLLRLYRAEGTMRRKAGEVPPTEWDRTMDEYACSINGAKAPALRKLVRALFEDRFKGRAVKGGGGDWMYEGEVQGLRVSMSIDWGGRYAQLRYGLTLETATDTIHLGRGFEGALGVGHGKWDFLTEENAVESIALLGDLIEDVAQWPALLIDRA